MALRISPKANQFILPSPQPLSMLLSQKGSSTSVKKKEGLGGSTGYDDLKMLPGDKQSFITAKMNLEAQYQSQLQKVFNEGVQSNEGWQTYLRSDSAINELQGYHNAYQQAKVALDSQKDLLENNLSKFKAQDTYLKAEGLTDNDYVFGFDQDGKDKVGIDTPNGTIYTIGQLRKYNEYAPYNEEFINYTVPQFDELDKLLKSKMSEAEADVSTIKGTSIIGSDQIGQGQSLKSVTETNVAKNRDRQMTAAWVSFMDVVKSDASLSRAFNIRKMQYDNTVSRLSEEDKAKMPSFDKYMLSTEQEKKRIHNYSKTTRPATEDELSIGVGDGNYPTNFFHNVIYGNDRLLSTVKQISIFDSPNRTAVTSVIPALKEIPGVNSLLTEFDNIADAIMTKGNYSNISSALLLDIVEKGIQEYNQVKQFDYNTPKGKEEFEYIIGKYKNQWLESQLNPEQLKSFVKELYTSPESIDTRTDDNGLSIYGEVADNFVSALSNTADAVLEAFYLKEKNKSKRGKDSSLSTEPELYNLFNDTKLQNFVINDNIRYASFIKTYEFSDDEFKKSKLNMKVVDDEILFLANYLNPESITSKEGAKPIIVASANSIYSDQPWKNTNGVYGAQVWVMVADQKEVTKGIKFDFPDQNGLMNTKTLRESDKSRFENQTIQWTTLDEKTYYRMDINKRVGYNIGDPVMLMKVNVRYDDIIKDDYEELPPKYQTEQYFSNYEAYKRARAVNRAWMGVENRSNSN